MKTRISTEAEKELILLKKIVDSQIIISKTDTISKITTHVFYIKVVGCTILSSSKAKGLFGFSFYSGLNQVNALLRILK